MKIKRRHIRKAWDATGSAIKKSKPVLMKIAPEVLDIAVDLLPASKSVKVAAKVSCPPRSRHVEMRES
jgi:hypothetical protein